MRLKRSGTWWCEANSSPRVALQYAKYNGTFERVFTRYQQRQQGVQKECMLPTSLYLSVSHIAITDVEQIKWALEL